MAIEAGRVYNARMFLGRFDSVCSAKGQIYFPSKLKSQTGEELLISNWFEYSLVVLPFKEGEDLMKLLTSENVTLLPEGRRLQRFLYGGAEKVRVNSEGRFTLPQNLKEHAKILREVIFRGVGDRIELWSRESYERYAFLTDEETRKTASELFFELKK